MRNWLRVTICIMLIVSVLAMSLSVFAVDTFPSPSIPPLDEGTGTVKEELMTRYIWYCLQAWGINIRYDNMDIFLDEVENQIFTWVLEYLAGLPSSYTVNQWIAPWQGDFDYWGNLRLNSSALEDIQDFADWLIDKLGLSDNSETPVTSTAIYGTYTLYNLGIYYTGTYNNEPAQTFEAAACVLVQGDVDYYFQFYNPNTNHMEWWGVTDSPNPGNVTVNVLRYNGEEDERSSTGFSIDTWIEGNNVYIGRIANPPQNSLGVDYVLAGNYFYGTWNDFYEFIESAEIYHVGGINVIAGTMLLPIMDTAYSPGDSITIVDGEPDYSLIEWDETVTVDNLPAIVSTRNINNPHLEEAYRPIQGLITYAKDGVEVCTALLYELPDELVYLWYGLIASILIWGMIKLMREH